MQYTIEPITQDHDISHFSCGLSTVDSYLKNWRIRNPAFETAKIYVLTEEGSREVLGFYTLSTSSVDATAVPPDFAVKIENASAPTVLVGRLGVSYEYSRQGLGSLLMAHALGQARKIKELAGTCALVVDANPEAVPFYRKLGFKEFLDNKTHMYISISTAQIAVDHTQ